MTPYAPIPEDYLDDYCQTCGGDGWEFCEDWDCWEPGCNGEWHECPNCHGSGRAKDQWYW